MTASIRRRIDRLHRLIAEVAERHAPAGRDVEAIRADMRKLLARPAALELAGELGEVAIDLNIDTHGPNVAAQLARDPRGAALLQRLAEALNAHEPQPRGHRMSSIEENIEARRQKRVTDAMIAQANGEPASTGNDAADELINLMAAEASGATPPGDEESLASTMANEASKAPEL